MNRSISNSNSPTNEINQYSYTLVHKVLHDFVWSSGSQLESARTGEKTRSSKDLGCNCLCFMTFLLCQKLVVVQLINGLVVIQVTASGRYISTRDIRHYDYSLWVFSHAYKYFFLSKFCVLFSECEINFIRVFLHLIFCLFYERYLFN